MMTGVVLVEIRCDGVGCDAFIKPNPNIASSGWTKRGSDHGPGTGTDKVENHLLPRLHHLKEPSRRIPAG